MAWEVLVTLCEGKQKVIITFSDYPTVATIFMSARSGCGYA